MINLKHCEIEEPIRLDNGEIGELVIENKPLLYHFIKDLIDSNDDDYSFTVEDKETKISNSCLIITDLFSLSPNTKKILTAWYKKIETNDLNAERRVQLASINKEISDFLLALSEESNCGVSFDNNISIPNLLGAASYKFNFVDGTFLENFVQYIKAFSEVMDIKLIVAFDLFAFIGQKDVNLLQEEMKLLGISVLSVSNFDYVLETKNMKKIIIDSDLCDIH
jgi:CRISPR type II-A-associated protein Csn2